MHPNDVFPNVSTGAFHVAQLKHSNRLNLTFLPKVLSPQYINEPIVLSSITDECDSVLCPVRALRQYVEVIGAWRVTDQLFVCYGEHKKV